MFHYSGGRTMVKKTAGAIVLLALGLIVLVGAAQMALAKGDYGPQKKIKREKGRFDTSATINTTNEPMPPQSYVDVIYAHSDDPNWADGGFYLDTSVCTIGIVAMCVNHVHVVLRRHWLVGGD